MDHDVAIVGAGPIGLATAAELKSRGLSVIQFDKGCIAKTVDWFPQGMRFYSSARYLELLDFPIATLGEKPTREEYLAYLRAFVRYHGLSVNTYEAVRSIVGEKGNFRITTAKRGEGERQYHVGRVVLAIGTTELPRRLGIPGEDLPHVSHYFTEAHRYFGQKVVIVGARNSACDAALQLARQGTDVTLVHRGEQIETRYLKYWIHPELTGMIRRGEIKTRLGAQVVAIDEKGVEVRILGGQTERIDCDFVLLLVGYKPDLSLIDQLGIDTSQARHEPAVDHKTFETNVPGVYCCGTIVAGAQNPYRVFIENARHHPAAIADAIEADLQHRSLPQHSTSIPAEEAGFTAETDLPGER